MRKPSYLEGHSDCGNHNPSEHRPAFKQARESSSLQLDIAPSVGSLQVRELFFLGTFLENTLGFDFQEFEFDEGMFRGEVTETSEDLPSLFFAVMVNEPAGREWHENDSDAKEQRWSKLKG